jgi:hypothetical protein
MSAQRSFIRRSAAIVGTLLAAVLLLGATSSFAVEPLNALVPTTIEVPLALRDFPFDHDRVLMVPPGFKISVLARIIAARFIMPLSTGEILVAEPDFGKILLVRRQANGMVDVSTLIDGLKLRFMNLESRRIKVQQDVPDCKLQGFAGPNSGTSQQPQ